MRVSQVDGAGAVCFDVSGRVSMVVQDDLADLFDEAESRGVSADEVINRMLDRAEGQKLAANMNEPREERCTCRRERAVCHSVPSVRPRRMRRRLYS